MSKIIEVKVPDLGGAPKADVIAINVKVGDAVAVDDALVTLEGDKASMDIPSPEAGVVKEIKLSMGDKVSQGSVILILEQQGSAQEKSAEPSTVAEEKAEAKKEAPKTTTPVKEDDSKESGVYAGPLVRRLAREKGIDLSTIHGSARNGRIMREDLEGYQGAGASSGPITGQGDQWGATEILALNKIKRVTAENMLRNWTTVPHVTQFDEADITELDAFREKYKNKTEKDGYKLTPLAFIVKAIAHSLKTFPTFNSSLDASGENLILKKYYHVGVAVDTPNGLVVPVLRDVDKKSIREIAKEMGELSIKARDKALLPKDMMGSTFTVSSLGGIGGTAFTPIVNVPNVAILGISKSKMQPVYDSESGQFVPRLMLPLSLSYDHRVIDGAEAARFIVHLSACLEDLKLLLL
jgi:pyruvate dehydrogenase E2 component (dihydrolipoamide acetyltransferase)